MKTKILILITLLAFIMVSCGDDKSPTDPTGDTENGSDNDNDGNTPDISTDYLTDVEEELIDILNYARTDPHAYADEVIKPLVEEAGSEWWAKYAQSAYDHLKAMPAEGVPAITNVTLGLTLTSRDQISDPKRDGHNGTHGQPGYRVLNYLDNPHGSPGSTIPFLTILEVAWPTAFDETIKAPGPEPDLMTGWIVDRGVPNYGHRLAVLNEDITHVGISHGYDENTGEWATYMILAISHYKDSFWDDDPYQEKDDINDSYVSPNVSWKVDRVVNNEVVQITP